MGRSSRRTSALLSGLVACACFTATPAAGHLLVTEVGYDTVDETTPTSEFVEIHNPGPAAVWLGNLWLANDEEAYPLLVNGPIGSGITLLDFVYRFPPIWLDAGRVLVVCQDSDAFLSEHFPSSGLSAFTSQPGAPMLLEVTADGEADGVPAMLDWGSNEPGTLSLANNGECVGLAEWDGASDRIRDQDWVCWVNLGYVPNKDVDYPFGVDGPDPDLDPTFFLEDLGTGVPAPDAPQGSSIHRVTLAEPDETASGGNGSAGHDETTEDWSGWTIGAYTPGRVSLDATSAPGPAGGALALGRAQPNPSPGPVRIPFALLRAGWVEVEVHDVLGRRVAAILAGWLPAGAHDAAWDGRDAAGHPVSAGVYFARLRFERETRSGAIVVAR